jgi:hypothetical protein
MRKFEAKTAPAATDQFKVADFMGTLVAITVNEVKLVTTKFGDKTAIAADVTICQGGLKGTDYTNVLIFSAGIVHDLRDCEPGETVVARIAEKVLGSGMSTYILEVPEVGEYEQVEAMFVADQTVLA